MVQIRTLAQLTVPSTRQSTLHIWAPWNLQPKIKPLYHDDPPLGKSPSSAGPRDSLLRPPDRAGDTAVKSGHGELRDRAAPGGAGLVPGVGPRHGPATPKGGPMGDVFLPASRGVPADPAGGEEGKPKPVRPAAGSLIAGRAARARPGAEERGIPEPHPSPRRRQPPGAINSNQLITYGTHRRPTAFCSPG